MAAHVEIDVRFLFRLQDLLRDSQIGFDVLNLCLDLFSHIGDEEKFTEVQVSIIHIISVEADQICACHIDSAMLQNVFLIRNIRNVDFLIIRPAAVVLMVLGGTFDLVDRPAGAVLLEDVHCAV